MQYSYTDPALIAAAIKVLVGAQGSPQAGLCLLDLSEALALNACAAVVIDVGTGFDPHTTTDGDVCFANDLLAVSAGLDINAILAAGVSVTGDVFTIGASVGLNVDSDVSATVNAAADLAICTLSGTGLVVNALASITLDVLAHVSAAISAGIAVEADIKAYLSACTDLLVHLDASVDLGALVSVILGGGCHKKREALLGLNLLGLGSGSSCQEPAEPYDVSYTKYCGKTLNVDVLIALGLHVVIAADGVYGTYQDCAAACVTEAAARCDGTLTLADIEVCLLVAFDNSCGGCKYVTGTLRHMPGENAMVDDLNSVCLAGLYEH